MTAGVQGSGENIDIELVALTEIDISELVEMMGVSGQKDERVIAFFDILNKSDRPWEWEQFDFQFVTEDGYTVETDPIHFPANNLPQGWHSGDASIPPSARIKALVSIGDIASDKRIDRIIYETKLAEAWYSALSRDQIAELSREFERIEIEVPEDSGHLDELPDVQH